MIFCTGNKKLIRAIADMEEADYSKEPELDAIYHIQKVTQKSKRI